jgi:uncharacterized protein (UPF0332 family)
MSKATITVAAHMEKAGQALTSARTLMDAKDCDGACNRAYYAMFDAAHAALLAIAPSVIETGIKTHGRLIGVFGERIIQPKLLASEFGRALNKVQHLRQVADYSGDQVGREDAAWAVEQAEAFVAAVRGLIVGIKP